MTFCAPVLAAWGEIVKQGVPRLALNQVSLLECPASCPVRCAGARRVRSRAAVMCPFMERHRTPRTGFDRLRHINQHEAGHRDKKRNLGNLPHCFQDRRCGQDRRLSETIRWLEGPTLGRGKSVRAGGSSENWPGTWERARNLSEPVFGGRRDWIQDSTHHLYQKARRKARIRFEITSPGPIKSSSEVSGSAGEDSMPIRSFSAKLQPPMATRVAFRHLNGNMPRKKLDLFRQ